MNYIPMRGRKALKSGLLYKATAVALLCLAVFSISAYAENVSSHSDSFQQKRVITGNVKDGAYEPLAGVSVVVKGGDAGVVTDVDGNFSIPLSENATTLVFKYIGFKTQEVEIGSRSIIDVVLYEDVSELDEVVVVGYGVQKKKLITGATIQVGGDNIQKLNTQNVLGALQSQAPGVNIVQHSGMPGEGFKVTIRGLGTIGNSAPLYVIDGIADADINTLNPSDIESIDVLKDAASAAIYGARAANGVILVTTKQGKAGKLQLNYDGYIGWQNVYKMPDLLNAKEYMTIINEARFISGQALYDFSQELPDYIYQSIMDGSWNGTNWMEEARNKNAVTQNHSFNLAGGSEQSKFSLGFSYSSQDGIIGKPVAPNYERYTFRLNSDHVLLKAKDFDVIKIGENLTYSHSNKSGIGIAMYASNNIHDMLCASPLMPVYDREGRYYDYDSMIKEGWTQTVAVNPIAAMVWTRGANLTKNYGLNANAYLEIQPIKNLRFRSSYGYKFSASSYRSYTAAYHLSSLSENTVDNVQQTQGSGYGWTFENTLSYVWKIDEHAFDAVIGQSLEKWGIGEDVDITNINSLFPNSFDHAYIVNTQAPSASTILSGAPWSNGSLASFFGRLNYNLKDTYMLSAVLRTDGSSNFAKGNRWGYFPSVSAGWVITNESFMSSVRDIIDFLKIRTSWGQNGNCNIDNFQYLATFAFDTENGYYFGNNTSAPLTGAYSDILPNPDVTWETSEQVNVGLDARFLASRLGLTFDWYTKTTKNWLVAAPILAIYGTSAPYINGGDVENKGVEIGLNWNDQIQSFRYGANFNIAYNKNKVTRIANTEGIIHGSESVLASGTAEMYRAQVGYPIGYFWGYKTAGVFQTQEQVDATVAKLDGAQPGDLIFVDTDHNGMIDDNDKVQIGDPHPDFTAGFSFNCAYKGFDFSMTATGAFGHQIAKSYRLFADTPLHNYTTDIFGRWHGEGTSNRLPRLTIGSHTNWKNISDIYIEDADYVKIQNITIGYDLKSLFKKLPLSQARIFVTAQNLFTITGYSGMDPEVGYGDDYIEGTNTWVSGIDIGFYPSPRTFLVGFNLKF